MATPIAASSEVEAVYRQNGDRLWRALFAFAGDEEVASDAVAEAFAQALRRGSAIRDVRAWVWRSAFRLAAGDLQRQSSLSRGPLPQAAVIGFKVLVPAEPDPCPEGVTGTGTDGWSTTGSMITKRVGPAAAFLPDGRVLVAGGVGGAICGDLFSAELYDPGSGT